MLYSKSLYQAVCHSWRSTIVSSSVTAILLQKRLLSKMPGSRQALLLSSSNCHGYDMLAFAKSEICAILTKNNVRELIFIPYAQKDYYNYTAKIRDAIQPWGFKVTGIHTFPDPIGAIQSAKAIFIGGGNTFLLLKKLYEHKLVNLINSRVHNGEMVYIGSSAGTNVATRSIHTTNDMPITYPPSFDSIGIVPFHINPHYIETPISDTHRGETRDQRIGEFLQMSHATPVLGLREGCMLHIDGTKLKLKGVAGAVLFEKDNEKKEYPVGSDVSFLYEHMAK